MRLLGSVLVLLALATPAAGQVVGQGAPATATQARAWSVRQPDLQATAALTSDTCPGTGCVELTVDGYSTLAFSLAGTLVSTSLSWEATINGTDWVAFPAWQINNTQSQVILVGATGQLIAPIAGFRKVRVRVNAYVSGTGDVTLRASQGPQLITNVTPQPTDVSVLHAGSAVSRSLGSLGIGEIFNPNAGGYSACTTYAYDTGAFIGTIKFRLGAASQSSQVSAWNMTDNTIEDTLQFDKLYAVPCGGMEIWALEVSAYTSGAFDYEMGMGDNPVPLPDITPAHIVCDSGCGSPPAIEDADPFVFGTTSVSPIAAVVDDVATNTVLENSYGAPRMSTDRILLVECAVGCAAGALGQATMAASAPVVIASDQTPVPVTIAAGDDATLGLPTDPFPAFPGDDGTVITQLKSIANGLSGVAQVALQTSTEAAITAIKNDLADGIPIETPLGDSVLDDAVDAVRIVPSGGSLAVSFVGTPSVTIAAGAANIGDVDVLTLPSIPAGVNNIGDVDVLTLPAISLAASANNIGDVDVLTLPALPAGGNNIGDVDVLTLPTITPPALTKGTQGATGFSVQPLVDAGRNARHFMLDAFTAAPVADATQTVVQWYGNAAVAGTAQPAVVPAGKTLRLTTWQISTKSLATVGSAVVRVRFNTGGLCVLASPLVFSFEAGSRSGATTVAMTGGTDTQTGTFPEGFELPAGGGICFSMAGYGPTGTLTLEGVTRFAVYGYEY